MILTPADIYAQIAAVAPIEGISLGSWTDKSTWTIQYQSSATDEQKAAAQAVIDAIDLTATPLAMAHRYVSKRTIRERLRAAGLEAAADAALAADSTKQKEWQEAQDIDSDDAAVIAMLTAIGADPVSILA